MIFAIIKQHLINFFFAAITFLMAMGGFVIIFTGSMEQANGSGYHSFEGIERLIGLVPILIGGTFFLMMIIDWKNKIKEVKARFQSEDF